MRRVAVVGAGIAGLSAAYRVLRAGAEPVILEASGRVGGKITTERTNGFILEGGPDAFITVKPDALALAKELGLSFMPTRRERQDVYVFARGRLRRLPDGLLLMAPSKVLPFLASDIVTWPGKLRMGLDFVLPRRTQEGDESLGDFTRRRLGREALETIVQPIMAGIYGGDADDLSLRSTFPRFQEIEKKYGSVIRGLRASSGKTPRSGEVTTFMSFVGGLADLPEALAARLEGRVRFNAAATALHRAGNRWRVELAGGDAVDADAVILTPLAWQSAGLLAGLDSGLAERLRAFPCTSTATLSLAFEGTVDAPWPPGFGFVVPRGEPGCVSAGTFTSEKFPNRAPKGAALLRCFLGGAGREVALQADDETLVAAARRDLERLIGLRSTPSLVRLRRWPRANPQYHVGHAERVAAVQQSLQAHPGLALAGASYNGIGIPDCIRSGADAADAVLKAVPA